MHFIVVNLYDTFKLFLLIIVFQFIVLPVPVLSYGPELLNPNDIEEGDAVFFLCNVYANPRAYKIIWKHNVSYT